jgi:NADH dehydrogenase FAD-containing subunit
MPPHRTPKVVREAGLTDDSGWIPVDRHPLATRFEGVYAIGDTVVLRLKMGRPLPKAGVFAHAQGEVVAHNPAVAWTGRGRPSQFDGVGACFIETGGALGLAGSPTAAAGLHGGRFWDSVLWPLRAKRRLSVSAAASPTSAAATIPPPRQPPPESASPARTRWR